MATTTINIVANEKLAHKLQLLMIWKNAGQPESFQVKSNEELIRVLINDAFGEMKTDKVGQRVLW